MSSPRPELAAAHRDITGKKVAGLRRAGRLPAVVYGHDVPSANLSIDTHDFETLRRQVGANVLIDLSIDGQKPQPVLVHGVAIHPVDRRPLHVDLLAVRMTEELIVDVPLVPTGEAEAIVKLLAARGVQVSERTVARRLARARQGERRRPMDKSRGFSEKELEALEARNEEIFQFWLAGHTTREVAKKYQLAQSQIVRIVALMRGLKLKTMHQSEKPPIYNVWNWSPRKGYGGPCIQCGKVNCAVGTTHDDSWVKTAKRLPEGVWQVKVEGLTWVLG